MDRYKEILRATELPTEPHLLSQILFHYPWFNTARIVRTVESKESDPLLEHYLLSNPLPLPMLYSISSEDMDFSTQSEGEEHGEVDEIDTTVATGGKRAGRAGRARRVRRATPPQHRSEKEGAEEVIDKFLNNGDGCRVQPKSDTPEEDVSVGSNVFELPDEMATEELAEIYLKQGLIKEAAEIYRKLGKKLPPERE